MKQWAVHSAAVAAAACPVAVTAAAAAFAVTAAAFAAAFAVTAAAAAAAAGFSVQPSCLVLSSCAARKPELLPLPCRKASQI